MSAGTRRDGSSKYGPFNRIGLGNRDPFGRKAEHGRDAEPAGGPAAYGRDQPYGDNRPFAGYDPYDELAQVGAHEDPCDAYYDPPGQRGDQYRESRESLDVGRDRHAERYSGRHVNPRGKTARTRVGKVVPAAAIAATLAAGATVYGFAGNGHPQAAELSDRLGLPVSLSGAAHAGSGKADAAASAMVRVASKAGTGAASASPRRAVIASPKATAKTEVSPSAGSSPASASPVVSASPTKTAAATLTCNLSSGLLPENVTAIVSYLVANGYSDNAASGIAGNIYQESKGNPESEGMGGGGLIGWTPLPSGFVTGNVTTDLQTQLAAILTYNQQWAAYLPALNAAASPADAADIYVTDFERAGIPAASTREAAADAVASACGI